MRTPQQLLNCRVVLIRMGGLYRLTGLLGSDENVNAFMEALQGDINYDYFNRVRKWQLKISLSADLVLPWEDISPEPKTPICSFNAMLKSCKALLDKHPDIRAIEIMDLEDNLCREVITR